MIHHKLVLPEFLNDQGFLFGGHLLKWIDELAYITARLDYPGRTFVTVSLADVTFQHRINQGQILEFSVKQQRLGKTSVSYHVAVHDSHQGKSGPVLFETAIVFVNIGPDGKPMPIKS